MHPRFRRADQEVVRPYANHVQVFLGFQRIARRDLDGARRQPPRPRQLRQSYLQDHEGQRHNKGESHHHLKIVEQLGIAGADLIDGAGRLQQPDCGHAPLHDRILTPSRPSTSTSWACPITFPLIARDTAPVFSQSSSRIVPLASPEASGNVNSFSARMT